MFGRVRLTTYLPVGSFLRLAFAKKVETFSAFFERRSLQQGMISRYLRALIER